jgi:oligoendopeptidase F
VVGYPDAVKQKVNTIADARSAPILAEIRNLVSSANDQAISALAKHPQKSPFPGKEMEKVCNSSQQLIKAAQQKAIRITSEAAVTQAQAEIEKLTDTLSKLRQEQYRRYQVAVIDKCDAAFRAYNEYWTVDKAEARKEFMKQGFATVDQSVLSPEVGRLFNDVLNKLMPRMKPEDLVKSEEEMSKVEGKIKLEDF